MASKRKLNPAQLSLLFLENPGKRWTRETMMSELGIPAWDEKHANAQSHFYAAVSEVRKRTLYSEAKQFLLCEAGEYYFAQAGQDWPALKRRLLRLLQRKQNDERRLADELDRAEARKMGPPKELWLIRAGLLKKAQ